jgi:hypothetical protein
MEKNKIVVQGKFEGSKMYFRKIDTKEKKKENYFLKLYKKIKKSEV